MTFALSAIIIPLAGSFMTVLAPKRLKPLLASVILGLTFLFTLPVIAQVVSGRQLAISWNLSSWFNLSFIADGLSAFMAAVSSFVAFLVSLYSLEYMEHYEDRDAFFFWVVLFVGSMMGLVFSGNLMLMFCFWEMTSVCSWRLIGFYRRDKDAKAADKAFLVTFFGASLMLIGIVLIYLETGTLELSTLKGYTVSKTVAFLILAGILSKSAQLPLQTWLPDAGVAPTPVTALLHAAVLVKIGIYVFARLFGITFLAPDAFFNATIALSLLTILVAAGSAMVENNMKRILAYSTISQLGYILFALALNERLAFQVALIYILAHSLAKAGLFLCAGIIEQKCGTKDITELGGLIKTMPFTATAYLLCAFSIIGIPPFLGFWPKFMVVLMAVQKGYILAGSLGIAGAVLTLFYLMRLFNSVFLGEIKIEKEEERNSPMTWVVIILGFLSLALGVAFALPFNLVSRLSQ